MVKSLIFMKQFFKLIFKSFSRICVCVESMVGRWLCCNQKERVRKYTTERLLSTNPGVHARLNHSTQLRPPKMYNSLTVCWIFTKSKTRKSFAPTHPQSRFHNMCPLPRPFTQSSTKGEHSHYIADLYTFRNHKLSFSPKFTETSAS